MKAEELMIGDLVRVNKDVSIKKGTIVKVRGIDGDRRFQELTGCATCVAVGDIDEMTCGVWLAYLEPIPLTPEILERNKIRYQFGMPWYQGGADGVFEFRYRSDDDTIEIRKAVRYVHELQHILKECGIEKEVEI